MKPIKICIVSLYAYHYFNPKIDSKFGGAELQLYNLATELAKDSRFDIHFIVGDFGQPDLEERKGVKLYKFSNPKGGLIRAFFTFCRLWRLLKKINADIYLQRAAGTGTGEVALFCRFYKKKFIYMTAHDKDVGIKKPSFFQQGLIGWIRWELFKLGLRLANLVIVQNVRQKNELKRNYNKDGILRMSAHFIPTEVDIPKKENILWVARCEEWKQPEIFIKLAKELPNEKFIMICQISKNVNYFEKIKTEAKKVSNLEFIDYVPSNEIDNFFLKAKIFVNTSETEGFPNTFIQAAKNKTPILSLNVNPDNMLEKFNIGRCANGDFEKLKSDLKELLENEKLWQQFSENAYKYAKENHDIKKIIEEDKKIITKLVKYA